LSCGIVVELDDRALALLVRLGTREEHGPLARLGQQIAHSPLGKPQHVAPLAEHDGLAALGEHGLLDERPQGTRFEIRNYTWHLWPWPDRVPTGLRKKVYNRTASLYLTVGMSEIKKRRLTSLEVPCPADRVYDDPDHSETEARFLLVGHSLAGRMLLVVHAERGDTIRVISARRTTSSERAEYEADA
jgi:uncharacterized DUF497 family protein